MKKFTSILLTIAMLMSLVPSLVFATDNSAFTDVTGTEYYAEQAAALSQMNVLAGYEDGSFGAEKSITRAEMAAIICRMIEKEDEAQKAQGETKFDDVNKNHWASGYINIASNEKIISGDGNGKFRPEDDVKYEEAIKMVVCALGFGDTVKNNADDWSAEYISIAKEKGITAALKGSKGKASTRGDIAVMVYNGMKTDVSAPTASLAAGSYTGTKSVTLATATKNADIYYTTDGSVPTAKSTKYSKAISISKTSTLKAITVKNGVLVSDVLSVEYTIKRSGGGGGGSSTPSVTNYTITFDLNYEGSTDSPTIQKVKSGNSATEPSKPLRDGFTFMGWFKDNQCTESYIFSESVTDNITLYAKWLETDNSTYTRAEWINMLMIKIDADIVENTAQTNYYADTEDTPYENAIEAAKGYGIIPSDEDEQDVPVFEPDKLADREFAAVTSVLAMGFVSNNDEMNFNDKADMKCPELCAIAVKEAFVNLENGYFYPERAIVGTEKNQIFETIDNIEKSAEITEKIENVTYSNDVISDSLKDIKDYTVIHNDNDTFTVSIIDCEETEQINSNDYFVLPPNEEHISGIALKANNIQKAEGRLIIEASKPEDVSKVMSKAVFSGLATADVNNVKVLDENITCSYDPEGTVENEDEVNLSGRVGGSFAVPGKWTFNFGDGVKIGEHAKLKGKTEVTIPDITAYLDADFGWFSVDVNELTVSITEKAKISGQLEYVVAESQFTEGYSGAKEFARVPFALGSTGLSIDLVFSLYYDIKGSISIIYTVEATQGIQYKDNNFRFIHNFNNQLDIPKVEGSGQVGIQPAINLVFCEIWDIIGISGKIGAAATVSLTNHATENLCCIDGTIYLSAKIGLNEDTLIGDFLKNKKHYTLEKEIYNANNSPLKLKLHFENLHKVPTCTYGQGKITGYVYDANTHEPVKYARVSVYQGDDLKAIKYTNSEGLYSVEDGLPVGNVTIKISATGYQTYSDNRQVNKNVVTYIESYMMVGRSDEGQGNVSGKFINALTGANIPGVTYEVRIGWNNTTGDFITSSSSEGTYNFDIVAGNYTILAKADNYISSSANITVTDGVCIQTDVTLSPEDSGSIDANKNLRFVLTWGENPSDLDSHLFGPTVDGNGIFHTYYSDKDYNNNGLVANLDLDDTTSYGPETTTIYKMNSSGTYSFYVHDYSNKSSSSCQAMSSSGAKVVIYNGNTLYATFNIPTNVGGTVWHVFDYDAQTGAITPVNTMSYSSDSSDLDLYSANIKNLTEEKAIKIITESAVDKD